MGNPSSCNNMFRDPTECSPVKGINENEKACRILLGKAILNNLEYM